MALIRKHGLYQLATVAWGVAVFAFIVLTLSGKARPYLSPDSLPVGGPFQLVALAAVAIVVGALAIARLENRDWERAGKRAGLTPRGGGILARAELGGPIDGREVRARTEKRATGGDAESGSNKTTFTVVETDLAAPTDRGLILSPTDGTGAGPESLPDVHSVQVTTVGNVAVLGESDAFAREMVTPRVQEAIAALENGATIDVGRAADLFLDALEDSGDGLAGSMVGPMAEELRERLPGGPESVGIEREGVILDGDILEARAEAVVAVADAFEDALAATSD